jgi:replication initiation protein RepC
MLHKDSSSTGLRKITPPMFSTLAAAERYVGGPDLTPGKVLAAFKAAAPTLGYRPSIVHAIDWLFRFTQPVDWQPGSRPVVWPSASMQQEAFGVGPSQVKKMNRQLVELGLVAMRDSPNGKRYGRRKNNNSNAAIIEAYGFDLSPLADRFTEFQSIAEEAQKTRVRKQKLRRRASIARNGIRQIIETAAEQHFTGPEWQRWQVDAMQAGRGIAGIMEADEMEFAVLRLERLQAEVRQELETAITARCKAHEVSPNPVNSDPTGALNEPHNRDTKRVFYFKKYVDAQEESSPGCDRGQIHGNRGLENPQNRDSRPDSDDETIKPDELIRLTPRLRMYLAKPAPTWPEIVHAADCLGQEMGISRSLWADACSQMGRQKAAVAMAVVSTKPADFFKRSAGGYFAGMLAKERTGELRLNRTIWGLRRSVPS